MKKTGNKKTIIAVILVFLLLFIMSACNEPVDEDDTPDGSLTPTRDMLVNNGTFYLGQHTAGTNVYVKDQVPGWKANSGSISFSETEAGVIDLTKDVFESNSRYVLMPDGEMSYPGIAPSTPKETKDGKTADEDTGALAISNVNKSNNSGSVYFATSSAITIKKNTYYHLIIDVYTDITDATVDEHKGAYIFITGGIYFEIPAINTEKSWQTYEFYLEGNNYEDRSINIELWLGHGPGYIGSQEDANRNPRITTGVALFDNIILTELASEKDTNFSEEKANFQDVEESGLVRKGSLVFADPNFTYAQKINSTTTVSSTTRYYYGAKVNTPQLYDLIIGKETLETGEDRPTVISGTSGTYGIFDMSKFWVKEDDEWVDSFKKLNGDFRAPDIADEAKGLMSFVGRGELDEYRALMIYHNKPSGAGYKSQKKLAIEANTYYTISVWVYVWKPAYEGEIVETEPSLVEAPEKVEKADKVDEPDVVPDPGEEASQEEQDAYQEYLEKKEAYEKYVAYEQYLEDKQDYDDYLKEKENYDKYQEYLNAPTRAQFKLTGSSVEGNLVRESEGAPENYLNKWQKLEFKVKGTQLSSRFVNLSFWYGEGVAGASTLSIGGALFDNLTITVDGTVEDNSELAGLDYTPISTLEKTDDDMTGLIETSVSGDYQSIDNYDSWKFEFAKGLNENNDLIDYGIIDGDAAINSERWQALDMGLDMPGTMILKDELGETVNYNVLLLNNLDYTAASLRYIGDPQNTYEEIKPNNFYRISMWVKIQGIDKGQGLTINLLNANDIDDIKTVTSISNINKAEWQEVIFYVKGDTLDANSISLEFIMGTGDTFTPTEHLKGAAFVTAIIMQSIDYKEFNDADTSDFAKKYTFTSTLDTSNTVTNGYFQNVDYEDTIKKDKDAFNDDGMLIGVATPSNWTFSEPVTSLDRPKNLKIDKENKKLTWDEVKKATSYEIYVTNAEIERGDGKYEMQYDKLVATIYVNQLTEATEPEWDFEGKGGINYYDISCSFKIRAITNAIVADDGKNIEYGISDYSQPIASEGATKLTSDIEADDSDYKVENGIINTQFYKDKAGKFGGDANLYPEAQLVDNKFSYFSTKSDNALMLSSEYYTRISYSMSSTITLSANSYYELSVWVKTIGSDTMASVTVNNSSNIFFKKSYTGEDPSIDGNFIGFVNINTSGKWVKYTFYAETSVIAATLKLELGLGNKYAKDQTDSAGNTVKGGLAKGTVFFDDIYFKSIDEDTYKKKLEADENTKIEIEEFFNNDFIYKNLLYTTDSFDIYTEAATDSKNGHTPKDYTHSFAPDAESGDEIISIYGVFKAAEISAEHAYIYEGFDTKEDNPDYIKPDFILEPFGIDELRAFLTGYGDNVLLMANFSDKTGQSYTSSTKTLNSESYYKITFFAKTMMDKDSFAEFRFEPGNDTENIRTIRINNEGKELNTEGFVEYTMYVHNPRTGSVSSNKISFHLGSKKAGETEDNFFAGMLVIDNVSFELIEKEEYDTASAAYEQFADNETLLNNSIINIYEFKQEEAPEEEPPEETEPPKQKWQFTDQMWLLISTIIIGAAIVAVMISVGYKKFKAKYKKKETVVSKVDTAKTVVKESQKRKATAKKDINLDEYKD